MHISKRQLTRCNTQHTHCNTLEGILPKTRTYAHFKKTPTFKNIYYSLSLDRLLQCVAVCCSVLRYVAVRCSALQCVAVCCSVLQCVVVCCSVSQYLAVLLTLARSPSTPHILCAPSPQLPQQRLRGQCVAVCYSVLQCVEVCCSVL